MAEATTTAEATMSDRSTDSVIDWQALAARLRVWLREIGAIKTPIKDDDK